MGRPMRVLAAALVLALAGAMAGRAADDYEIGAGDVLRITVLGQADMTGEFPVDSEGVISFPLLGKIKAAALSAPELERKLTTLLADGYLKRPQVTVTVKEYGSQKVYVTGEVARPGPYPLRADRSLLALLADIGPLGANAGHEVVVIRPPTGSVAPPLLLDGARPSGEGAPTDPAAFPELPGAETFRVSVQELQSGNAERNILLHPGDTVYVPKAGQVYITGSVARPGPYRYQEGATVLQALTLAGGVTERGSSKRVKILRIVGGKKVEIKAQLTEPVLPEDTIVVPERFF
jgi:polysaccharide export outer membrane protein